MGREIARLLVARGYEVLVTDVTPESAEETASLLGGRAWARTLDVRDPEAHRAAAAEACARGRLAVWVNNAGILRTDKAWAHSDEEVRLMVEPTCSGSCTGRAPRSRRSARRAAT
jgi:NAD(P)-dependent dehydrogenase (short-subunit alcohol dehydrogenase family)